MECFFHNTIIFLYFRSLRVCGFSLCARLNASHAVILAMNREKLSVSLCIYFFYRRHGLPVKWQHIFSYNCWALSK